MSYTFTFTDKSSVLTSRFNPPIHLDNPQLQYGLALTSFDTFNSIPNITHTNNLFHFGSKIIIIPTGSYEITDLNRAITAQLDKDEHVSITANNNTLKTHIKTSEAIDFTKSNSVGPLLGFTIKRVLDKNQRHESDEPCNILTVNSLLINCNVTTGSYKNGTTAHTIYQFFPSVPPGFKIIERPLHLTYLPISVKTLTEITLHICDQDGKIVNFRGETVTIGLHLKGFPNNDPV